MRSEETSIRTSVALCTYNGARYLPEQLQSMVSQENKPDELIICDDGSTDETILLVQAFARTSPFEVRIIRNDCNLGPAANFEKAIKNCRGELIVLCDQDDIWLPQKLRVLQKSLETHPDKCGAFSDAWVIDGQGCTVNTSLWKTIGFSGIPINGNANTFLRVLLKKNVVTGATMMVRKAMMQHVFPIPPVWLHDGWLAWIIGVQGGMIAIDQPLIKYRVHDKQHASIRSRSLKKRIEVSARQIDGRTLLKRIAQLEILDARLNQIGSPFATEWSMKVRNAKRHMHFRLSAGNSGLLLRFMHALLHVCDYERYTEGLQTLLRDVVLPHHLSDKTGTTTKLRPNDVS
jgi:glycosyltransferase involved in cell wall biosynthesis